MEQHFTSYRHPLYDELSPIWDKTWDHYAADIEALRKEKHLFKRVQGETNEQYEERRKQADYLPLFGTVVDAITGRLQTAEKKDFRVWEEEGQLGLGHPSEKESVAGKLWYDIDGAGTNYLTQLAEVAITLAALHTVWGVAEGVGLDEDGKRVGESSSRYIDPRAVVNWIDDDAGNPIEVLVRHTKDLRTSVRDKIKPQVRYRLYALEGYEDFHVIKDGDKESVESQGFKPYAPGFVFYKQADRREKILPIWRTRLPLRRMVGHLWADKNNIIFNRESQRDNLLLVANTPLLQLVADEETKKIIEADREKGSNILMSDPRSTRSHEFMAPSSEPAQISSDVLQKKIEHFFLSAFRSYEDAVKGTQTTATEIDHKSAMGEETFLNTLATAMDEYESNEWWRLEQINFPDEPAKWGQFKSERPKDFRPLSEGSEAKRLATLFFGLDPVPIGPTGRASAAKKIGKLSDVEYDEGEIDDEARESEIAMRQEIAAIESIKDIDEEELSAVA